MAECRWSFVSLVTAEGCVAVGIDGRGNGVLVELNCQSDFAARGPSFRSLARQMARTALTVPREHEMSRDALLAASLTSAEGDDDALVRELKGAPVATALGELVARLGEAVRLRRVERRIASAAPGGVLSAYAHGSDDGNGLLAGDGSRTLVALGRVGSLVVLEARGAPASLQAGQSALSQLAARLAQHVVGCSPQFVSRAEIDDALLAQLSSNAAAAAKHDKNVRDDTPDTSRLAVARRLALLDQPCVCRDIC
jgi:translation elongation factor EF-Ts